MKLSQLVYYTYIVKCSDGNYYTGKTKDLDSRIKQHNGLLPGGAKYTEQRRPVKLVHYERYATNAFACHREAEIKRLTHQQKKI
jgi:putative endonuclease